MSTSYVGKHEVEVLRRTIFHDEPERQEVAAVEEVEEVEEVVDAYASPEADRLFPRPTPEQAEHCLRDLTWGEHIVATRMAAARGNSTSYLYSLPEAAVFFLDGNSGGASLGSSGSFAWVDLDTFVSWIRNTVGDSAFADVLEERLASQDTYNDQIETLRQVLDLRMTQYRPYLPSEDEEDDKEAKETDQ